MLGSFQHLFWYELLRISVSRPLLCLAVGLSAAPNASRSLSSGQHYDHRTSFFRWNLLLLDLVSCKLEWKNPQGTLCFHGCLWASSKCYHSQESIWLRTSSCMQLGLVKRLAPAVSDRQTSGFKSALAIICKAKWWQSKKVDLQCHSSHSSCVFSVICELTQSR